MVSFLPRTLEPKVRSVTYAELIEIKNEMNKDDSGKGQWSAWKAA